MTAVGAAATTVASGLQRPAASAISANLVEVHHQVSGPLPAPEDLAAYERTLSGASNRIITMAETEQAHRHKQESQVTLANIQAQQRQLDIAALQVSSIKWSDLVGQVLGWSVSIAAVGGAIYLAMNNHEAAASALVLLPIAAIIRALRGNSSSPQKKTDKSGVA